MKTKQQIIDRIIERWKSTDINSMDKILTEELPDFNPMKIDEERFKELWEKGLPHRDWDTSWMKELVEKYNSTLPSPLVPLPKEIPGWFMATYVQSARLALWQELLQHYGTPSKEPLPSVEELAKEMLNVWNVNTFNEVAEYVIEKYSLHPREWWQEWWMKLKKGDKFMRGDVIYTVREHGSCLISENGDILFTDQCAPYVPPTAQDIIAKHNLTDEEVRVIREGK